MANKPKHTKSKNSDVVAANEIYEAGKRAAGDEIVRVKSQAEQDRLDVEAAANIRMKDADESQARFLRILFLRRTKERLKKDGAWSEFCRKNNIDLKNADYEISKVGEFKDEFLLKFGSAVGYEINKIKYITGGDSEKLGVEVKGNALYYQGEKVPMSEAPDIIATIQADRQKERDEHAADKRAMQRNLGDKEKKIHKLIKEIDRYEGRARAKDLTPEEDGFLAFLDQRKIQFDGYMVTVEPGRIDELKDGEGENKVTPRMRAAYLETLGYMRRQITAAHDTAVEMYGHDMALEGESWKPGK